MFRMGNWRLSAATWAGAAWFVLQQFGVPASSPAGRDTRIVRVEEAGTEASDLETLKDGRILTVPVVIERNRNSQDGREESSGLISWN
jgi:hypothetical protein